MEKKKEELGRLHKQNCLELKKMRAEMAEKLGIDLKQTECTYEGYCSGTCPKCRKEEMMLNAALLKINIEKAGFASKVAVAGAATVAVLGMAGCDFQKAEQLEGDVMLTTEYLEEDTSASREETEYLEEDTSTSREETEYFEEGNMVSTEEIEALEGDIALPLEETEEENGF